MQTKLIPIYHLTRKGIPFDWGAEQQNAFDEIKKLLSKPPVLVMPDNKGHIVLVSDTSKVGCGGALYQEIRGEYRLISYCSKKLPEAVQRYSISELELTGLLANISTFKHILRNAVFTVYCDHSALVYIINAKREPPTLRLKKLIENLSEYCFVIRFLKGKEMQITDFLSRHPGCTDESPYEIIPIAFMILSDLMQIEVTSKGEMTWSTTIDQDLKQIYKYPHEGVMNLFVEAISKVQSGDSLNKEQAHIGTAALANQIYEVVCEDQNRKS